MAEARLKRRPGFVTRRVGGETVVVPVLAATQRPEPGGPQLDFVVLNESGELLWTALQSERTRPQLARELMDAYGISEASAVADSAAFVASLLEIGALTETV